MVYRTADSGRVDQSAQRKFNVTAKGGLVEEKYVDWVISRPYIFLVLLNLLGVAAGVWRYYYGPENETLTVIVSPCGSSTTGHSRRRSCGFGRE